MGQDREMHNTLVSLRAVSRVYHRDQFDVVALDKCDLDIGAGAFVALMGPSGSGKSTVLNLIAGFDAPTTGTIHVDGVNIGAMREDQLARWRVRGLGFIFQFHHLIPVLTAFENVELPLLLLKMRRDERRRRVLTALHVVGLEDRAEHYPRQLSGGEEQRVSIARAVVTDPKLILADEPTGNLDAKSADEVLSVLEQLNQRFSKTIVMVTHDTKAASRARRLVRLEKGVVLAALPGPPA